MINKSIVKKIIVVCFSFGVFDSAYAADGTLLDSVQKEFTRDNSKQVMMATPNSFYDLTMGGLGWTHNSAWLYMKLKKDVQYTVTAAADQAAIGFHPGIACFYRPQGAGLVGINYMYAHMYSQFNSHIQKNMVEELTKKKLGTFKSYFIINGYDRDGMENPIPVEYQQGPVVGLVDDVKGANPGSVTISFVPDKTGIYQCVVGGINPESSLNIRSKYNIDVSVTGL